jgi:hypothetical protein
LSQRAHSYFLFGGTPDCETAALAKVSASRENYPSGNFC